MLALVALLALSPPACAAAGEDDPQRLIDKAVGDYCRAVSDTAAEQRMALQTEALKTLETRVSERIGLLEKRKEELEALIREREELRNLAEKEIVNIYAGMDPGVAATQMEKVDARLASSVLRQLKPRQASLILNEMNPELAARMVRLIASAALPAGPQK